MWLDVDLDSVDESTRADLYKAVDGSYIFVSSIQLRLLRLLKTWKHYFLKNIDHLPDVGSRVDLTISNWIQ